MNDVLTRFPPNRTAALERLSRFVPKSGSLYAARRNYDLGRDGHDHVSAMSPYIRARSVTETEVLQAVLARHSPTAAEKFIQEVFWRTYWKGWLEMRPSVWTHYHAGLTQALAAVQTQEGLRTRWTAACTAKTGIDCFDAWALELVETGYLHNHARMWFASIWIFTLDLPWELGADFFLRHLLDGDPASNTLGWRWVAGLQTRGKTYLARASNIEKYTEGRFNPEGALALQATPRAETTLPERLSVPNPQFADPHKRTGLILHDDDLSPAFLIDAGLNQVATCMVNTRSKLSPLSVAPHVSDFADGLLDDTQIRWGARLGPVTRAETPKQIADWAREHALDQIASPYAPVGPNSDLLRNLSLTQDTPPLRQIRRPYDSAAWPHATAGFFKFKAKIPKLLGQITGLNVID